MVKQIRQSMLKHRVAVPVKWLEEVGRGVSTHASMRRVFTTSVTAKDAYIRFIAFIDINRF